MVCELCVCVRAGHRSLLDNLIAVGVEGVPVGQAAVSADAPAAVPVDDDRTEVPEELEEILGRVLI